MPTTRVRDKCGGLPPPPVDQARSTSSCLAPTGGPVKAAPSCSKGMIKHLGTCQTFGSGSRGRLCSWGSKSKNRWCSITMSSSLVSSEVVEAAGGSCSGIPSGGGPCPPLESDITVVVCLCPDHTRSTPSHLAHTGGVAPATSSCQVLGSDSVQASENCP